MIKYKNINEFLKSFQISESATRFLDRKVYFIKRILEVDITYVITHIKDNYPDLGYNLYCNIYLGSEFISNIVFNSNKVINNLEIVEECKR